MNWFKLSSSIFYEKNVGPTSSNIVRKRIQYFLSNMLDDFADYVIELVGLVFPYL